MRQLPCSSGIMQEFCPRMCATCTPKSESAPRCEKGQGVMGKMGYAAQLLDEMLKRIEVHADMGLPTVRVQHPNGSLEIRGTRRFVVFEPMALTPETTEAHGPWTGCAVDAFKDNIDLCISAFWDTPLKREYAVLTTPIMNDYYRLVSSFSIRGYSFEDTTLVFAPISLSVWALLFCVT